MRWLPWLLVLMVVGCSGSSPEPVASKWKPPWDAGAEPLKSPVWQMHKKNGKEYLDKQKYDEAIDELTKALALSEDAELLVWRADAHRVKKQLKEATDDCDRAIALEPNYLPAYLLRGYVHADQQEYDKAIADLTKVIDGQKDVPFDAYFVRGRCYFHFKHDYAKAISDFDAALKLDGKHALAWMLRADAQLARGDYVAAVADYTEILKLRPDDVDVLLARSEAHLRHKKYTEALADADTAIQLAANHAGGYSKRGWAHFGLRHYDKAIAAFTKAIELQPTNPVHYGDRGRCHAAWHHYDEALLDHHQAIKLGPKDASLYYDRGKALLAKRDFKAAMADFTTATQLDPQFAEAWLGWAETLQRLDSDPTPALRKTFELCNQAIHEHANDDVAVLVRGQAFLLQGSYLQALADFEQVLKLDSNSHDAHRLVAWIQATCPQRRLRDGDSAMNHATKACISTDFTDAECLDALAAASAQAGKFDNAVKCARDAHRLAWKEFQPEVAARLELYSVHKVYRSQ
jgi:tetratricopeptide (TPR) repeat protein